MKERVTREFECDGTDWLAIEAWRGRGGHRLCYMLKLEGGAAVADDRSDRRAILAPAESLDELDTDGLAALLAGAGPLSETERRLVDTEGVPWLAQASGPVWAEGGVAAGMAGLVFTRLQGPFERLTVQDDRVPGASSERWRALLERARTAAEHD